MADAEQIDESKKPSKLISLDEDGMININGSDYSDHADFIRDSDISYEYAI